MVLPAIIPAIGSALAWIGIDLGISWFTRDSSDVSYVSGLDFQQFIGAYWLPLLIYALMMASAIALAIPKHKNDGWETRY